MSEAWTNPVSFRAAGACGIGTNCIPDASGGPTPGATHSSSEGGEPLNSFAMSQPGWVALVYRDRTRSRENNPALEIWLNQYNRSLPCGGPNPAPDN